MRKERKAGVLMPITALPSPYGIGTLGKEAYRFVDGLKKGGVKIWQVLPLLPTGFGNSPYQACAAYALNYYLIDLPTLEEEGLLLRSEYENVDFGDDPKRVDYGKLFASRTDVLRKAFSRFDRSKTDWKEFLCEGRYADFALFMSLKVKFSHRPYREWGEAFSKFDETLTGLYARENREEIEFWQFTQFVFLKQWRVLKRYANERGVELMGDMPIYLSADSVEAWKYGEELFLTNERGECSPVAGVPPDAFSEDGQLWGTPVYNWKKMKENGYAWWKGRIDYALTLFDILRIDHFRGFDRFYAIPEGETSARKGEWLDGPKEALFRDFKNSSIVAEDLGVIDDGVRELMRKTGYAGMKVMSFAFDGNPENEHLPSKYAENVFAYTGTHDNAPFFAMIAAMTDEEKAAFAVTMDEQCEKLGVKKAKREGKAQTEKAVELLYASKAAAAIVPYHDVLALGAEARINFPSELSEDNWSYRYLPNDFSAATWARLRSLAERYGR